MIKHSFRIILLAFILAKCSPIENQDFDENFNHLSYSKDILNYRITPQQKFDKNGLMFSDQGAWFAYSFKKESNESIGFSGPFLMTQQNGVWLTTSFSDLTINEKDNDPIALRNEKKNAYSSHLEQRFNATNINVLQTLVFKNGHTALIKTSIKNTSNKNIYLELSWGHSPILADGISFELNSNQLQINSTKTSAIGFLNFSDDVKVNLIDQRHYQALSNISLAPNESKEIVISQSFIFPEYDWLKEKKLISETNFDELLSSRKSEKDQQLKHLIENRKNIFIDSVYAKVLAKAQLTLQNNWRIPAGEIKHEGLFPSYHYKWFNGFWSWDSWKHSVGLSFYDTDLAKKQLKLMFEFQNEDGFVADCVYRDTSIEAHNYRDTKPPLAAWAVVKIFEKDKDVDFLKYMYPKLKKYHEWWYLKRDHDQDGLCEYGSTDGSLVAAKWESGMDNAIRFDHSKIVKNSEGAFSLNQESVDLNAYLYAEKLFLAEISQILENKDVDGYLKQAEKLKKVIQNQFYDEKDGWFYDTNLDGDKFIKGAGSEGWTALWANAATIEQAEAVKNSMMDPMKFYTNVPFQTMSAAHPKFDPLKGYWRGPNWLDQAYFGVKGLQNYGYNKEANEATLQILKGAQGLLEEGKAIRENYHPITGEGLHAKNFSWSAAHIIMLLMDK